MRKTYITIFILLLSGLFQTVRSQSTCPDNIGFEWGDFTNWKCFAGKIMSSGVLTLSPVPPVTGRHTIVQNTIPQAIDPYGNFPVNCPNGSGYSIKLGNNMTGAEAERVSYTFTVPANKNEYSIIYNYAIVFQNPGHTPAEQPKFTSKVYDETEGQYLGCGSFEYVASTALPGFQLSSTGTGVWFKPWSPVTIKLLNCAGKKITLEFTVNDCSPGGHFGYAYLDVNENCASPITGNVFCNGATSINLAAPFGFKEYHWFSADFSTLLGTGNTLKLSPIPPVGTKIALEIVPFPGVGCLDTIYTTIEKSSQSFVFKVQDTVIGCNGYPADLTQSFVTQGSSSGLMYSYFLDSTAIDYLGTPTYVAGEGVYYIKAQNTAGCTETKPVKLKFRDVKLVLNDPPETCFPNTVNITAPSISAGSDPGLSFTYWKDDQASQPVSNPSAISQPGLYYVQARSIDCKIMSSVNVRIISADQFKTNLLTNCSFVDLTNPSATAGSVPGFNFSYWSDITATNPIANPKKVSSSGIYYIKGSAASGCSFIKPIQVTVKPEPVISINTPAAVTAPAVVDITNSVTAQQSYTTTYWMDSLALKPLLNPSSIAKAGIYYIKSVDTSGCYTIKPISVTILIPAKPDIKYPNAFSPNGDGVNDAFRIDIAGDITFNTLKVFNRWGQVVFETKDPLKYWYGDNKGKALPAGTYYWIMELENNYDKEFYRRSGAITLLR